MTFRLRLRRRSSVFSLCLYLFILAGCGRSDRFGEQSAPPRPITLFAAASTANAIDELRAAFTAENGTRVRTNFAASSTLAQQILHGAEADLLLSANERWADELTKAKLVARRQDLLGNELVVVVAVDSRLVLTQPSDLLAGNVKRVALGDPESVPAGVYARQALEKLGLWNGLKPKVVAAADVRQALSLVELAAADAGIVFATDAAASGAVRVALRVDPSLCDPIRYPLVLLKPAEPHPEAQPFYEFLTGPKAAAIFRRHGFKVLDAAQVPR